MRLTSPASPASDEHALVEKARTDPDAFGQLFDIHYRPILRFLVHRTADVALAEDLASRTFLKAYERLWQFRWRSVPFRAWLYRIALNEVRAHYRAPVSRTLSLEAMMEDAGYDVADGTDLARELADAQQVAERHAQFLRVRREIDALPVRYREVLTLRFLDGKKIDEIAVILGKRTGTIKSLLSRGLAKIREKTSRDRDDSLQPILPDRILTPDPYDS